MATASAAARTTLLTNGVIEVNPPSSRVSNYDNSNTAPCLNFGQQKGQSHSNNNELWAWK